jgi:hypothetical protein
MATLATKDLGTIETETQTKESNLFFQPLPYSDSTSAILLDLMGTSRTIQIEGMWIDTTKSNLQTYVSDIESIQNGQQSGSTYVGDFVTTDKTVLIQTFTWTWSAGDPGRIKYSLSLVEGTPI